MIEHIEAQLSNVVDTPCWVKTLQKSVDKYTKTGGGYLHRISLAEKLGRDLLFGMEADHLCYVKACFNPDHLEEVTQGENLTRCKEVYTNLESEKLPFNNGMVRPVFKENLDREDDPKVRKLILRAERYMKKRGGKNLK